MANYHVMKDKETGEWRVVREGAEHAAASFETQAEAEKAAKQFCSASGGGEVRIHTPDGQIRDSDTIPPANDPYPPADRRH